jgi:hypothetical protein
LNDGNWHFIRISTSRQFQVGAVFIDGAIDGRLALATVGSITTGSASLYVGYDGTSYFTGSLQEIRLSSRSNLPNDAITTYIVDVIQFPDNAWTIALFHFNEGLGSIAYDSSITRNPLVFNVVPTWIEGSLLINPISVVRDQVWMAIDAYQPLTTFLAVRQGLKYRMREGDRTPSNITEQDCPALIIAPLSAPLIEPRTSAFHQLLIDILIDGYMYAKAPGEIEHFWWIVVKSVFKKYNQGITAGRFNFSRIHQMIDLGPSFKVQQIEENTFVSEFHDTLQFTVREDLLT